MNAQQNKSALANYAVQKIGGRIFTFGDGSDSDKAVSPVYDQCRRYCLEQCPWSFGTKTLPLQALSLPSTSAVLNFGDRVTVAYAMPPDFLKPYLINFPYALTKFQNLPGNGLVLLSDTQGLVINYIFDNDDPTTYSAKFYEYLACKVAKEACFKLSEAVQYVSSIKAEMESAFIEAAASDGQMSSPDQIIQDEWEAARLTGSGGFVSYPSGNITFFPWNPNLL